MHCIQNKDRKHAYVFSLVLLVFLTISTDAFAIFTSGKNPADTEKVGLRQQELLDLDLPLTQTTWPGAHNAYAAHDDWGYAIPNQAWKIEKLLGWGLRLFEIDAHPTFETYKYVPRMCHHSGEENAVCAIGNESLETGLDEFSDFLDDNSNSVVILKIEAYDVTHSVYNYDHLKSIKSRIKSHNIYDHVFLPADVPSEMVQWDSSGCSSLPVQNLTKRDVLNAGKQLIILINLDPGGNRCNYYEDLEEVAFIGVDVQDSTGAITTNNTMLKAANDANYPADVNFIHDQDDAHYWGDEADLYGGEIREQFRAGKNTSEAALVEWDAYGGLFSVYHWPELKDFSWSWHKTEPNGGTSQNCAAVREDGSRIGNTDCSNDYEYACYNQDTEVWAIAGPAGDWEDGPAACDTLDGNYRFAVPRNAIEMIDLSDVRDALAPGDNIWLNYSDQEEEGTWVPDAAYKTGWLDADDPSGNADNEQISNHLSKGNIHCDNPILVEARRKSDGLNASMTGQVFEFNDTSEGFLCWNSDNGGSSSNVTCHDYEVRFTFDSTACIDPSKGYTTGWLDADNPTGHADAELISVHYDQGNIHCTEPVLVEAVRKSDGVDASQTGQVFGSYNTTEGFICWNEDNGGSSTVTTCDDYKVRYTFKSEACTDSSAAYKTGWLDADNPTGHADNEQISHHFSKGNIHCTNPVNVEARRKSDGVDASQTGQVFEFNDTSEGFLCWNSDNGGSSSNVTCDDYEVRFTFDSPSCIN